MSETVQEADRSHLQQKIDTVLLVFMNAFAHRSGYGQSFVDVGIQLYRDAPRHSFQNPRKFCEWFKDEIRRCDASMSRLPNVYNWLRRICQVGKPQGLCQVFRQRNGIPELVRGTHHPMAVNIPPQCFNNKNHFLFFFIFLMSKGILIKDICK